MKATFNSASFYRTFNNSIDALEGFERLLKILKELEKENITNRVQFFGQKIVISMPITDDNKTIYEVIKSWSLSGGQARENYRYLITILSKIQTNKYAPEPGKRITIDGISFLIPENHSDSVLISIQSEEKFADSVLIGNLDDKKEIRMANIAKEKHIWEYRLLLGMRIYEYNEKHSRYKQIPYGKGKISSVMDLDDEDSQTLLNRAIYIDGKLCASKNNQCYVFMNHRDVYYHGFLEENPSDKIKRTLGLR